MSYLDKLKRLEGGRTDRQPDAGQEVIIEPACRPDGSPLTAVYWQRSTVEIVGPAKPEFFARVGSGTRDEDFWVVAQLEGCPVWIRSDRLRSKQQFETQRKPKVYVPVKGLR